MSCCAAKRSPVRGSGWKKGKSVPWPSKRQRESQWWKRGSVRKVGERRSGKAKTGEEAEFRDLNEHSEPVFNAA
ncbi:hypothetical protein C4K24_3362 [Pseudomonas chlororaphis subsp. aurantiaca]|nr:hypothetical protein C4K24_3362 [Pseudomonas chlororaphis subsp. aurantiaca]